MRVIYLMRAVPEWTFGDRIRKARTFLKMKQDPFARALSEAAGYPISDTTVGAWELDTNAPRGGKKDAVITALAGMTGWAPEWFEGKLDGHTPDPEPGTRISSGWRLTTRRARANRRLAGRMNTDDTVQDVGARRVA